MIAPANFVTEADVAPGRALLEAAGFEVEYCPHLFEREGQFAGADAVRAQSLMDAFADPSVAAIIGARGGYGSPRLMELVNWRKIADHPKPFIGYSDLTAVLTRLVHDCGMRAFHGPVLRDIKGQGEGMTAQWLIRTLKGEAPDWAQATQKAEVIAEGQASGPLVGGNLTMLASICGTGAGFSAHGAILLLEDIAEYIYRLDRALVQLRQAGALAGARGVVIADLIEVEDGNVPFGMTAHEMIAAHFPGVPIIAGVPAGHGPEKLTLALGVETTLSAKPGNMSLVQSA